MKNQSGTGSGERITASFERLLASFTPLSAEDLEGLRSRFLHPIATHPIGGQVNIAPDRNEARLVVEGWIARGAMLEDGRRQIVGLSLPGDVIVASGAIDGEMAAWALTPAATTDATLFWQGVSEPGTPSPGLWKAWRAFQAAERLRLARQVIRLGRLNAYERTAHLLLELHERQARLGANDSGSIHLPLTQDVLADILGLSAVHMNRTLQQLRRNGLADHRAGRTFLPDLKALALAAGLKAATDLPEPRETAFTSAGRNPVAGGR